MSTSYTSSAKLGKPGLADRNWATPLNATIDSIDALAPVGGLCVTTKEVPSSTLNVKVAAGSYLLQDGTVGTYAGTSSHAIASTSTKVAYIDSTGTLVVGASYPTVAHVRLATVTTSGSAITSITDDRVVPQELGTFAARNWTFDTTTGTQIGTGTTQKLAFWGATPIVQPTSTTDLRTLLINVGLLATGGASPLNLNGGALTVGSATIADAGNVAVGTGTGTKIGTATSQKLGFFNATPVAQPTNANETALTDSTTGVASVTHTLVDVTATPTQATINANFATVAVLLNQLRADLVALGLVKGS